jgi:hypothetical protein
MPKNGCSGLNSNGFSVHIHKFSVLFSQVLCSLFTSSLFSFRKLSALISQRFSQFLALKALMALNVFTPLFAISPSWPRRFHGPTTPSYSSHQICNFSYCHVRERICCSHHRLSCKRKNLLLISSFVI